MAETHERCISWRQLAAHRSEGAASHRSLWLAIDGAAYDVSAWAKRHPGGELVLQHAAGRDASDAFAAYHPPQVAARLAAFRLGRMETRTPGPPSQADEVFRRLKRDVEAAGLMQPRPGAYAATAALLACLLAAAICFAAAGRLLPAALATALFWQQAAFVGHDAGHNAVTHDRRTDTALGFAVNAALGIGISWWKSTHNVHHTVVNAADSDPDIQFMPLLAVSEHFFGDVWSRYHQDWLAFDAAAQCLIPWQHLTFLPLLMVAKFGLYLQTAKQLAGGKIYGHRGPELAAQAAFFLWYGCLAACFPGWRKLAFVAASHAAFFVLHLQICLSHFACPTAGSAAQLAPDWMSQQVQGTMNWSCPPWLDWFHGGLQFQIEHHLFPRMPRHNLRAAAALVRPACGRAGLRYHSPSFLQAIWETLQLLRAVALKARRQGSSSGSGSSAGERPPMATLSRAFI